MKVSATDRPAAGPHDCCRAAIPREISGTGYTQLRRPCPRCGAEFVAAYFNGVLGAAVLDTYGDDGPGLYDELERRANAIEYFGTDPLDPRIIADSLWLQRHERWALRLPPRVVRFLRTFWSY